MENNNIYPLLSGHDKDNIGEFIYSLQNDILIIQDALSVLDVLESHGVEIPELMKQRVNGLDDEILDDIVNILNNLFSKSEKKLIMDHYYGITK